VLRLQEKNGHLGAIDRRVRAVVPAAAASRDALVPESFDPVGERTGTWNVEEGTRTDRRDVRGTVLGLQKEYGDLVATDGVVPAVVTSAAPRRDSASKDGLAATAGSRTKVTGFVTTTSFKVPGRRIGVTASSSVESMYVTPVSGTLPMVTVDPATKPVPLITIGTSSDAEPESG
jgi:hypothetical protein